MNQENHECLIFEPEDAERLRKVASVLLQGSDSMRDQGSLLDYLIHRSVKVDEEVLIQNIWSFQLRNRL